MKGEIVGGIILDPISDDWAVAVRGEGAWVAAPGRQHHSASRRIRGAVGGNDGQRVMALPAEGASPGRDREPVAGRDGGRSALLGAYLSARPAAGYLHFSFSSSVMPWDHAAGWLIHREAGGYTAHFDGSPYRPVNRGGGLISAPDRASWQAFARRASAASGLILLEVVVDGRAAQAEHARDIGRRIAPAEGAVAGKIRDELLLLERGSFPRWRGRVRASSSGCIR